jgi:hypothetical protein
MPVKLNVPNYAAEGRIREACAVAGIRSECLEDVIGRYRAGHFNEATLPDKLAEWRATPDHHFFSATQGDTEAEAIASFGPNSNVDAQLAYFKKHGEDKAAQVAKEFGTMLGGKPGKVPTHYKTPDKSADGIDLPRGSKNPWSAEAWDIGEQRRLVRVLGETKAAGIAKSAGSFVGATSPNSKPLISRFARSQ